jgi:putative ubiquitin-RnfH superfamily antitoxin RatB of RatAB toxin-antitoxin module
MSSDHVEYIEVEVAYARPDTQVILAVKAENGATVEDAVKLSGILHNFPEIDLAVNKVGIFGKLTKLNSPLRGGDRIEIYRALIADPKEIRKQRAAQGKVMKKGGGEDKTGAAQADES